MAKPNKILAKRIRSLKEHLREENPLLVEVVGFFEQMDRIGYRTGFLDTDESFADNISWWPLVSILGTFSAGKSTFINSYLGVALQKTGNQAVDDKFTVITYSRENEVRTLPGIALDADPRFPFYQISEEIEKVSAGEGGRIDSYLQLKTCPSERIKGKILIDSPGFDADEQRNTILRLTDHIIGLSDLVLVFFDARHPEPGAMQDTLEHLVRRTIERNDANKFVFILNQIDTTAKEDNLEEVMAAWQKAIVQTGLSAGTFYAIFDENSMVPIEDDAVRERYFRRRNHDLAEIEARIDQVGVERSYRIIGALENTTNQIEQHWVPRLQEALRRWRRRVLWSDLAVFGTLAAAVGVVGFVQGWWQRLDLQAMLAQFDPVADWWKVLLAVAVVVGLVWLHALLRKWNANAVARSLQKAGVNPAVIKAFRKNTRFRHFLFRRRPVGWGRGARRRLARIRQATDRLVQELNNRFANPSGEQTEPLRDDSARG